MTDREKLIDIINTACEGYAENLMQPYGAEVLADYLIANGVRISPWISVKDRLPEPNVFVIVYVTNPAGWWDIELDCVDEHENWTINADSDWHTVSHWMPLPEPPKEAEDANW